MMTSGEKEEASTANKCQQCSEAIGEHDSKPTYTLEGEISGRICDACRLKNVEYARRCQLTTCKAKSEGKSSGLRMLPAKFYSLREGDVKRRLIKQFGITPDTKACCNVCYLGMSKAITQLKIVYGDDVLQKETGKTTTIVQAGRIAKPGSGTSPAVHSGNSSGGASSNSDGYQGPQFKWGSNTMPQFRRQSNDAVMEDDKNNIDNTEADISEQKSKPNPVLLTDVPLPPVVSNASDANSVVSADQTTSASSASGSASQEIISSANLSTVTMTETTSHPAGEAPSKEQLTTNIPMNANGSSEMEHQDDADSSCADFSKLTKPSPSKRNKRKHEDLDFVKFDYFVSCIGCQKICSVKEAKAAYDYEQGYIGRLCNACRMKRREENKHCSILGCETPENEVVLRSLPPSINLIKGRLKGNIWSMFGITKDTRLCCKLCWKKITAIVKPKLHAAAIKKAKATLTANGSSDDGSFTVCLACHRIVKSTETYCKTIDGIPDPKVLCMNCLSEEDRKNGTYVRADGKCPKATVRIPGKSQHNGICQVTNCVSSGTPTVLVSCERLVKRSGEEGKVREKFNLAGTNLCCRSCLQRVKWFMIELLKAKDQYNALPRRGKKHQGMKMKEERSNGPDELDAYASPSMVAVRSIERAPSAGATPNETFNQSASSSSSPPTSCNQSSAPVRNRNIHDPIIHHPVARQHAGKFSPSSASVSHHSHNAARSDADHSQDFPVNSPLVIPQTSPGATHPPVIQVGGQHLILSVIHRCDKDTQTSPALPVSTSIGAKSFGNHSSYNVACERTKSAMRQRGQEILDGLMDNFNHLTGGDGRSLLTDLYFQKESAMISGYRQLLTSLGEQYRNLSDDSADERLRLLSTTALYSSCDTLKASFHKIQDDEEVPVSESEIVMARHYAKTFGPGVVVSSTETVKAFIANPDNSKDIEVEWDSPSSQKSLNDDQKEDCCMEQNGIYDIPIVMPRDIKVDPSHAEEADIHHEATTCVLSDQSVMQPNVADSSVIKQESERINNFMTEHHPSHDSPSDSFNNEESFMDSSGSFKTKRTRTHFTRDERDLLELYFQQSPYMSKAMFAEIKTKVELDKKKIDTWFRNRRSKAKKDEYDLKVKRAIDAIDEANSTKGDAEESPAYMDDTVSSEADGTSPVKENVAHELGINDDGEESLSIEAANQPVNGDHVDVPLAMKASTVGENMADSLSTMDVAIAQLSPQIRTAEPSQDETPAGQNVDAQLSSEAIQTESKAHKIPIVPNEVPPSSHPADFNSATAISPLERDQLLT